MLTIIALPAGLAGLEILCLFIGMIYLAALFIGRRLEFLAGSLHPAPTRRQRGKYCLRMERESFGGDIS